MTAAPAGRVARVLLGLLAALALSAGCAAPEQATDEARGAVRDEVDQRLGQLPRDEPGVVAEARVRALLADGVTEDEAVRVTVLSNRAITARYAELGVHTAELAVASLWANPVLDVGLLFFEDGTEIELGLSQSFVNAILRPRREAAARRGLDAARARVAREVVGRAYATRRAHVEALAARERLELESRHAAAAEAAVELARRLHAAGNTTAVALALEEAALSERLLERSAAERALLAARESLAREMGLWGELAAFELAGSLRADPAGGLELERVESRAIASSLDLAERRAQVAALTQEAGLAELDARLQEAELGVGAAREHDSSDWGLGPRGSLGIPLVDTGSARGFGARARVAAAEADAWARAVAIRSMARTFRDRLRALDAEARFAREVLVPAELRVVEETLRNYNAMQVGVFDVLRAQGVALAADRRRVALSAEAAKARLDLEELLAGRANDARLFLDGHSAAGSTPRTTAGGH
ncbi:MAG: TolC family protein [Planctomycetes bacterium]|nr:TolC family protein [Planctomycetota bacterium]